MYQTDVLKLNVDDDDDDDDKCPHLCGSDVSQHILRSIAKSEGVETGQHYNK